MGTDFLWGSMKISWNEVVVTTAQSCKCTQHMLSVPGILNGTLQKTRFGFSQGWGGNSIVFAIPLEGSCRSHNGL